MRPTSRCPSCAPCRACFAASLCFSALTVLRLQTTAGSFNRSVWKATGHAIGVEARAFMNAGHAYSTYWAPVINLAREPRWGRNLECAGEDPLLSGEYAAAFVGGLKGLRRWYT